jgi:hypothetical protein
MPEEYSVEQLEMMIALAKAKKAQEDLSVLALQRLSAKPDTANAMRMDFSGGSCISNSCNGG